MNGTEDVSGAFPPLKETILRRESERVKKSRLGMMKRRKNGQTSKYGESSAAGLKNWKLNKGHPNNDVDPNQLGAAWTTQVINLTVNSWRKKKTLRLFFDKKNSFVERNFSLVQRILLTS